VTRRAAILCLLAVVAGVAFYFLGSRWKKARRDPAQQSTPQLAGRDALKPSATPGTHDSQMLEGITTVLAKLRRNAGTAADLAALRSLLFADPAAGISAIRNFLASHEDAAINQTLTVGPGGTLTGAPTLRLFLLDILGQLASLTRSGDAAIISRQILANKDAPDEWALALRNIAWGEPDSRPFLAEKMREMLSYEPWRATPTAGLLQAFDVAVYSGDPQFITTFSELAQSGQPAVERAAIVALDRLAETSTLAVLNYLNAHPNEIANLPLVRADYFAKADLTNPEQRAAVEHYLSRGDVTETEKTKFLHALPAPGTFVSDSLLSTSVRPGDGSARYAGIAAATTAWLQANRFPSLRGHILWLMQRVALAE
jgi:hypothetical protein